MGETELVWSRPMRSGPRTLGCSLAIVACLSQPRQAAASPPPPSAPTPTSAPATAPAPATPAPATPAREQRATRAEVGFGAAAALLGTGTGLMLLGGAFGIAMPLVAKRSHRELVATQDLILFCQDDQHPQQCKGIDVDALGERADKAAANEALAQRLDPQLGVGLAIAGLVLVVGGAGLFMGMTRARHDKRVSILPSWSPWGGGVMLEGRF